jgi:ribosome modulation factor
MTMKSDNFPWVELLDEAEARNFYEEIQSIAVQAHELGTSVEDFAERLERNITQWRDIAMAGKSKTVEPGDLPIALHHYSYGYQQWIDGRYKDYCGRCDMPKTDEVHFGSDSLIKWYRSGALFVRGDVIREKGSAEDADRWLIRGVGPRGYELKKLPFSSTTESEIHPREAVERLYEIEQAASRPEELRGLPHPFVSPHGVGYGMSLPGSCQCFRPKDDPLHV